MRFGRAGWYLTLLLGCQPKSSGPVRPASATDGPATIEFLPSACVTSAPERCFDATDDNCNGVIDEGCGVDTGPVQFLIAWEAAKADVDLLVTDPAGELAEVGRTLGSGLTKQQDCPGKEDECQSGNMENVFLDASQAPKGKYSVRIVLESLNGESLPIRVRFGGRLGSRSFGREIVLDRVDSTHQQDFFSQ